VVHRSDGSGTTFNFTNYLGKVSPEWKQKVGEGTSVQWPAGVGGKGNEGVAAYVKQIKGAIGYVELSYALQNKMAYASLRNAAGNFVAAGAESFAAAAASADWASAKDFNLVITDAPGAEAWPITATNFILMHKQPQGRGEIERGAAPSSSGSMPTAMRRPRPCTTCRCPMRWCSRSSAYWSTQLAQ
jgi:phosphate transport system substrate-binding protein